jgi:hypothetical protein
MRCARFTSRSARSRAGPDGRHAPDSARWCARSAPAISSSVARPTDRDQGEGVSKGPPPVERDENGRQHAREQERPRDPRYELQVQARQPRGPRRSARASTRRPTIWSFSWEISELTSQVLLDEGGTSTPVSTRPTPGQATPSPPPPSCSFCSPFAAKREGKILCCGKFSAKT